MQMNARAKASVSEEEEREKGNRCVCVLGEGCRGRFDDESIRARAENGEVFRCTSTAIVSRVTKYKILACGRAKETLSGEWVVLRDGERPSIYVETARK